MPPTPKQEAEELMNALVPVAEKHLAEFQTFYPFGGLLLSDGTVELTGVYTGEERPNPAEMITLLEAALKKGLIESRGKASALVVDILVTPPDQSAKTDAIRVALDHASGYSVDVVFPYRIVDGHPKLGPPFAQARQSPPFDS